MRKFYPKTGQKYWMINSRFEVKQTEHTGSKKSKARISAGNAFRTEPAAEEFKHFVQSREVVRFDKRIAFGYGLATGAFIAALICAEVWR